MTGQTNPNEGWPILPDPWDALNSPSETRGLGYRGGTISRDIIQRRECVNCGREIGERHDPDCPSLLLPHPVYGRPFSIVDQETAITVRYLREAT